MLIRKQPIYQQQFNCPAAVLNDKNCHRLWAIIAAQPHPKREPRTHGIGQSGAAKPVRSSPTIESDPHAIRTALLFNLPTPHDSGRLLAHDIGVGQHSSQSG
jgi:hypothetical protein